MAVVLAVTKLFDDVAARFTAESTACSFAFGWREPSKRGATPRISFVPGDDKAGDLGEMAGAKSGAFPERSLMTLGELVTVYVEAFDPADPENERSQYLKTRELFDAFMRAVYLAARGTYLVKSANWITTAKERRHGAAIRLVLAVQAKIPDAPMATAPADTGARNTPVLNNDGDDPAHDEPDANAPDVIAPGG